MNLRIGVILGVVAVSTSGWFLLRDDDPAQAPVAAEMASPQPSTKTRFGGAREDCRTRSEANFPGAFTSPQNVVIGPLAITGAAYTDAETVRKFGGNKFPLLVKAGHVVTLRLPRSHRKTAALAYGQLPQGEVTLEDAHASVTFVACKPGNPTKRYQENGPSGSSADGESVTFWSGFVLTREPACIPLEVYVDAAPTPDRVGLSLGQRCL